MSLPQHYLVVGVDGSRQSIDALRWAARQARITGARLDAVIAWQYPIAASGLGFVPAAEIDDIDYEGLAAATLSTAIDQAGDIPATVEIRQIVASGDASTVLLRAAEGADLLVVGSRGHGTFAEALLGSVSNRCVHHATCPVVVMRTHDQADLARSGG